MRGKQAEKEKTILGRSSGNLDSKKGQKKESREVGIATPKMKTPPAYQLGASSEPKTKQRGKKKAKGKPRKGITAAIVVWGPEKDSEKECKKKNAKKKK